MSDDFVDFYDPEFYDLSVGPGSRVADLYRSLAPAVPGPVLELGCGTGDVVLALAEVGIETWGIDASSSMLDRARARLAERPREIRDRVTLVHGRMESVVVSQAFGQVLLTNDVIAHLLDRRALARTLQNCRAHLSANGRLLLDASRFDTRYLARLADSFGPVQRDRGATRLENGSSIQVWERSTFDDDTGILTASFRYEIMDSRGRLKEGFDRRLRLRPRRPEEIAFALESVGFIDVQVSSTTRGDEKVFVLAARAPGDAHPSHSATPGD